MLVIPEPDCAARFAHIEGNVFGTCFAVKTVNHILSVAFATEPCLAAVTLPTTRRAGDRLES